MASPDVTRSSRSSGARVEIDPRGPRFNAAVTTLVLAVVLVLAPGPIPTALLAAQTALFATGAVRGVQHTPLAWLFRRVIRPRLAPPVHLEDAAPPRFAQGVGLLFGLVGLAGYLSGAVVLGAVATGLALAAALLNAAFGLCLGCEVYLLLRRIAAKITINEESNTKEEVTA